MKLIKCYVFSFGKLKDFSLDFSDGINTIKEDNGWGKSTLASFIKAVFYGLSGTNKRSVSDNERIKFKPWNSTETFGGFVEFEWDGKKYKLERYFGNKDSEDRVALTDLTTGKVYDNETTVWGKRIFEIDEEGFLSSTYLSQKDFQIKSNSSITAKYNSVYGAGDPEAFDNAIENVEKQMKKYKYRGDKGLLPDARRELNFVLEDIERAELEINANKALTVQAEKLTDEVDSLRKSVQNLTAKVSESSEIQALAVKKEQYDKLSAQLKQVNAEKKEISELLSGKILNDAELTRLSQYERNMESNRSAGALIQKEVDNIQEELSQKQQKAPSNKKTFIMFALAALLFVAGAITVGLSTIVGIVCFGLGLVLLVITLFVTLPKKDQTKLVLEDLLEKKKTQLLEYETRVQDNKKELDDYLIGINFGVSAGYAEKIELLKGLNQKIAEIDRAALTLNEGILQLQPAVDKFSSYKNEVDIESLKTKLKIAEDEFSEKANKLAAIKASINRYEECAERLNELERRKSEISTNIEEYERKYKILSLTHEYLMRADERLKIKYRAPLQDSLNKYLKMIDENIEVKIDVDLIVTTVEKGGDRSTDYYSKGYQNLFEICKRFALTDVLFSGEKPFIILDDPFYNLDDDKLNAAVELIKNLSKEYQILYFVCHESRRV